MEDFVAAPASAPAPAPAPATVPAPAHTDPLLHFAEPAHPIQREHDSLDDFEHLDRERDASPARAARDRTPEPEAAKLPEDEPPREADLLSLGADPPSWSKVESEAKSAQNFLDTEREEVTVATARVAPEEVLFADVREELSPAQSEESLPDAVETFTSPSTPRKMPPQPEEEEEEEIEKFDTAEKIVEPEYEPEPPAPRPATPPSKPAVQPPAPASAPAPTRPAMEAEVIFCQMGLDAWFDPARLHPKVESLVYWRSPAKSGIALGAGLLLLLALACCSLISVLAYTSLLTLTATTAFRIYCCVLQAIQKTSDGHPFKDLLETDLSVSPERAQELAAVATAHLNAAASELRRLFLVEDLVDSLKFGVSLWCLTYLGAWFNGMTLLIIGYVALFTLPKVYETNKAQIDANLELVSAKFLEVTNKVKAAIPIGKKGESEKDK